MAALFLACFCGCRNQPDKVVLIEEGPKAFDFLSAAVSEPKCKGIVFRHPTDSEKAVIPKNREVYTLVIMFPYSSGLAPDVRDAFLIPPQSQHSSGVHVRGIVQSIATQMCAAVNGEGATVTE
jgi:hypothetical protein